MMTDTFHTSKPIYLQLVDRINSQILRQELMPGDKLPSVREMAIESGVNPNTIQRTYSELERMSIVETKRGQGTFVTEDESVLIDLREKVKQEHLKQFIDGMENMGFSSDEILRSLQDYFYRSGSKRGTNE